MQKKKEWEKKRQLWSFIQSHSDNFVIRNLCVALEAHLLTHEWAARFNDKNGVSKRFFRFFH